MKSVKQLPFLLFFVTVLVQWYVPASLVVKSERVIKEGVPFKFKTVPVDPHDPFRGKYMVLGFEANEYINNTGLGWERGEHAFVEVETASDGFARIVRLHSKEPATGAHYFQAMIRNKYAHDGAEKIILEYPFSRFYLEESKAEKVEELYRELSAAGEEDVYALVNLKNGNAVMKAVMVDGVSILDLVD